MKVYNFFLAIMILLFLGCSSNTEDVELAKNTVDKFYFLDEQNDYKSIDSLISTQFYIATPYYELVEFLKNKKITMGSFKEKELESYNISVSTNSKTQVFLKYKIKYTIKEVQESFLLEKDRNVFKIVKYSIQ